MKQLKTTFFIVVIFILIIFLCFTIIIPFVPYEPYYFEKLNIRVGDTSLQVIEKLGHPIYKESVEQNVQKLIYSDCEILLISSQFASVRIIGQKYRFGYLNIGIGSKRSTVEFAYKGKKKLHNTADGYIDNGYWITFFYDENNLVKEIQISYGP